MELNYNGVSHSSSTYQLNTYVFLEKLGIQKKGWFLNYNNGSTEAVDSFLGIKYILSKKNIKKEYEEVFEQEGITAYENLNALPYAFAVENGIIELDLNNELGNTFETQNKIYKTITGKNKNIFTEEENYEIETNNLSESEKNGNKTYKKINEKENASIIYKIKVTDELNLYTNIVSNDDNEIEIYINDEKYGNAFYEFNTEMISMGKFEKGDEIKLEIKLKKSKFVLKDIKIYYENTALLEEYCNILKQQKVNLEVINSSKLKGTVNIKGNNKYILFTIPYSKGWKIKVDGEEIETYEIMDALLAIQIESGEHSIEMNYTPVGFNNGLLISIISLVLALSILVIDKKSHKKVENKEKM